MKSKRRDALVIVLLWCIATAMALAGRPLISPDETRYLGVAWEMWSKGEFLVPHLNGLPYSDKPPLLFWLFHLGWALGGVSEVWPRLIGPLCALGSAFLLIPIARRLWPGRADAGWAAMVALPGTLGWMVYGNFVLFDMLLTVGVLVALLGVLMAWRTGRAIGWLVFGLGVGLALFAKGPASLVNILPAPLLAPVWMRDLRPARWRTWYAGFGLAFLLGVVIVLAWAVPAGIAGGAAYRDAIFLRQTADRIMSGAAHGRPLWWYLPVIPALLLPWFLWPVAWRAVGAARRSLADSGVRLCLAWLGTAFVVFSLTSGKQAHYLLPVLPALALLWDAGWSGIRDDERRSTLWGPAGFLVLGGLALAALPHLQVATSKNPWMGDIRAWPAVALLAAALGVVLLNRRMRPQQLPLLVTAAALTCITLLELAVLPALRPQFDVGPLAGRLRHFQEEGFSIAHVAKYNAQWHFAGRMTEPFEVVPSMPAATEWMAQHPRHVVIHYVRTGDGPRAAAAGEECSPFRDRLVCLIIADAASAP